MNNSFKNGDLVWIPSEVMLMINSDITLTQIMEKTKKPGVAILVEETSDCWKILYKNKFRFIYKSNIYKMENHNAD